MKNHFALNCLCWLRSRILLKRQSFCYIFLSAHPSRSLKLLKHLATSSGGHHSGNPHGCFGASFPYHTFIPGHDFGTQVRTVHKVCSDQIPWRLDKRDTFPHKFVFEIIDIVREDGDELESKLNVLASKLSIHSVTEIFETLNARRISGLRFFQWIWNTNHQLRRSALICSLIIDNVGRIDDYETMYLWLQKFACENIYLTYKAFRFLAVSASTDSLSRESTTRVVELLCKVGGSCCNSGVPALVEMFCKLELLEMAVYVIKIAKIKDSYFCLLIREKCRRGLIEDAYAIIRAMREANYATTRTMYNYILGSLWKNGRMDEASALLAEMEEVGVQPDAITYEILISSVCRLGKMDDVYQLLDQMKVQGLEPRPATLACIVKALFAAEKYEEAHRYVVDSSTISKKTSGNFMYSLMAKLYWEKGDVMSARNTLVEMMGNSLKPDFSIYIKILKQFRRTGREDLARDLESMHSKL